MRRFLIGIIILTPLSVFFNYFQNWKERSRVAKPNPAILGSEVKRSVENIEYFDYHDGGVLRFRIRARRLLETRSGKNLLEGIEGCDFNPDGSVRNEIRSQRAEYDESNPNAKTADFSGDVRLKLNGKVELRTDSLHYDVTAGVGSTPDLLHFFSEEFSGTARGVRFEQKQKSLALNSEVDLSLSRALNSSNPDAKAEKIHATSQRAHFSEHSNRILFEGQARIESAVQSLSGESIETLLDPVNKRITSITAAGNAAYESIDPKGKRRMTGGGDRMFFAITPQGILEKMSVSGQSSFSSISVSDEEKLSSRDIDVQFDAQALPSQIQAHGNVSFSMKRESEDVALSGDHVTALFSPGTRSVERVHIQGNGRMSTAREEAAEISELEADDILVHLREINGKSAWKALRAEGRAHYLSKPKDGKSRKPARSLRASLLELYPAGEGGYFESGRATGKVVFSEESAGKATGPQIRQLFADNAHFDFFPGNNQLKKLDAGGGVHIIYEKNGGPGKEAQLEEFQTFSDQLSAEFAQKTGDIVSATQSGHFIYSDGSRSASSGRCDYDGVNQILVLKESPEISDARQRTTGNLMEYDQVRKVLSVHGKVRSRLNASKNSGPILGVSSGSSPAIITANEMLYWTVTERVHYSGKVQLLSESQQLWADTLDISGGLDKVEAKGGIRHVMATKQAVFGKAKGKTKPDKSSVPTVVRSNEMTYLKGKNTITYVGAVTLNSRSADLFSDILDIELDSEGNPKHASASGSVSMHAGARECKGDFADYYTDPEKFVVRAKPGKVAEMYNPQIPCAKTDNPGAVCRGRTSARQLTYIPADDTILLEQ